MTRCNLLRLSATVAGLAALTALSGCASAMNEARADAAAISPPITETQIWESRVTVEAAPDEILLALHGEGLSPRQVEAVDALVARWVDAEAREIVIAAPIGGRDAAAAGAMVAATRARLVQAGAPASSLRVTGYDAGGDKSPVLRVGYLRHTAITPVCGQNWDDLTATRRNDVYANFGCAVAANIAAQVANPQDLLGPRTTTPVDAARRDTVFDKYRKGEKTSSIREPQASGAISEAVK